MCIPIAFLLYVFMSCISITSQHQFFYFLSFSELLVNKKAFRISPEGLFYYG